MDTIYKTLETVEVTRVHENTALRVTMNHPIQFVNGETEFTYFVK